MDPRRSSGTGGLPGLPRTRGDGPGMSYFRNPAEQASPHTRGWTRPELHRHRLHPGFPAHAGMDPGTSRRRQSPRRLPRTRGDGPYIIQQRFLIRMASPHTRGWTRPQRPARLPGQGFPAHAGMDPRATRRSRSATRLPRTRGDGPDSFAFHDESDAASPHTRGWTVPTPTDHV